MLYIVLQILFLFEILLIKVGLPNKLSLKPISLQGSYVRIIMVYTVIYLLAS